MNDIEKEIEGVNDYELNKDGGFNINNRQKDFNDNKRKKIVLIVTIILIILLIGGFTIYYLLNKLGANKNNNTSVEDTNKETKEEIKEETISYVSCDDNTSLLNVRNSTSGTIIDGLSCFKNVSIEEKATGDDNCPLWYKVSYQKRENSYTGYVCSKYIKEITLSSNTKKIIDDLISKAMDYAVNSTSKAYCGETSSTKTIEFKTEDDSITGEYLKSKYKSLDELKSYLSSFMSDSLIKKELKLSDINNPKYLDDYYEIDDNLYCRNYSASGLIATYTGNYDIEIVSSSDNKIEGKIAYEYITEEAIKDGKCTISNISKCNNADITYEISNFIIDKQDNNYIITKLTFPRS